MSNKKLQPLRIVRIQAVQGVEIDKDALLDKIVQSIKQKNEKIERFDNILESSIEEIQYQFKVEEINNLLMSTLIIKDRDYELENISKDNAMSFNFIDSTLPYSPSNVLSTFVIFVAPSHDEHQAAEVAKQFSHILSKHNIGIGLTRGCLISIFETDKEEFNRYYFLSPIDHERRGKEKVDETLSDIKNIFCYTAELSRLYGGCKSFFSALKPGEREISEKTEDFLWKLIGPETVDLETLESWLGYIMERESSLSAMISTMQMNRIEAESIVSKIENTFKKMSEKSYDDYPMNLDMEAGAYRNISKSFDDYITRSEALKARLETVNENVRTYLSIQQQKITMEEQKASREQLVRLVNLQEIFHKVEIFIVAVYMTEMARTIFEAVVHEEALIFTAIFIPIALILAIGISRLLHRH